MNHDNEPDQTTLFTAIAFFERDRRKNTATVRDAITSGVDINAWNEDGETALTEAIEGGEGSPAAVALLLELGADPDVRNRRGFTPWGICLQRARDRVVARKMEKIKALLEPKISDRSDELVFELEHAIDESDLPTIQELIATMNPASLSAFEPLTYAVDIGNIEVTRFLLQQGFKSDRNYRNEPLAYYPAINGDQAMIELLHESGVDISGHAHDDPQQTCEFVARLNGHKALADWLRSVAAQA